MEMWSRVVVVLYYNLEWEFECREYNDFGDAGRMTGRTLESLSYNIFTVEVGEIRNICVVPLLLKIKCMGKV